MTFNKVAEFSAVCLPASPELLVVNMVARGQWTFASGVFFSRGARCGSVRCSCSPHAIYLYVRTPSWTVVRFAHLGSHWSLAEALHRENTCTRSMYWNCFRLGASLDMGSY